jgi:hypothetical protein
MKHPQKWKVVKRLQTKPTIEWNLVETDLGILFQEIDWKMITFTFFNEEDLRKMIPKGIYHHRAADKILNELINYKIEKRNSKINNILNY